MDKLKGKQDLPNSEEYQKVVKDHTPKAPLLKHLLAAFVVGGGICAFAQIIMNFFVSRGMSAEDAAKPMLVIVIFIGGLLTALGIYDDWGEFGGAGAAIPITGFANSVISSAMEFKREGYVLGLGSKLFSVAGPVIVFAILVGFVVGFLSEFVF